jgi:hypothetical protein
MLVGAEEFGGALGKDFEAPGALDRHALMEHMA